MHNRRNFIRNLGILGVVTMIPSYVGAFVEKDTILGDYSKEVLMGKANVSLVGKGYKLREVVDIAFKELVKHASKDGFNPYIASSYRSYNHQKRIWDNKYVKYTKKGLIPRQAIDKIIKYSTIPGTSRHHWGTDFDIIGSASNVPKNPLNERHFNKGGQYYKFKLWMLKNANQYGFYEVYTNDTNRKGFEYEPWHYSYAPISCKMLSEYLEKDIISELYKSNIKGSEHFTQQFLTEYLNENLLDINPLLVP